MSDDPAPGAPVGEARRWKRAASLTTRILAVNVFVILLLVGGFLYLDGYRTRLVETRLESLTHDTEMITIALDVSSAEADNDVIRRLAASSISCGVAPTTTQSRSAEARPNNPSRTQPPTSKQRPASRPWRSAGFIESWWVGEVCVHVACPDAACSSIAPARCEFTGAATARA